MFPPKTRSQDQFAILDCSHHLNGSPCLGFVSTGNSRAIGSINFFNSLFKKDDMFWTAKNTSKDLTKHDCFSPL